MASPPRLSDKEVEEQLRDAGIWLQKPPSSTEELLNLLDKVDCLLSKIEQGPSKSVRNALQPSMKALIDTELLRNANTEVKLSLASCISEITRITAPYTPYSDEEMKEYFQLSVIAVERISYTLDRCYSKVVTVLKTLANFRVCVLMLDLELDELIVKMFQQFLNTTRSGQPDAVIFYMEKIMTLLIEESEDPSLELLTLLLTSVKNENQNVSPFSWELGQKVLKNCSDKIKCDLPIAVASMKSAYDDYAEIVASICQQNAPGRDCVEAQELVSDAICLGEVSQAVDKVPKSVTNNDSALSKNDDTQGNEKSLIPLHRCQQRGSDSRSNSQVENKDNREAIAEESNHPEATQKKRGRKPNSLRKEEEGYDHSWIIGVSSYLRMPSQRKNPKKKNGNLSKSSASTSEPGKGTQPHVFSVRSMSVSPSRNPPGLPEGIDQKMRQKKKIESLMNHENGLDLLSVSVGDVLRAQDEEKEAPERADATVGKECGGSSGDATAKRKRAHGKNVSEVTGDAKAKRRRGLWKNVIDINNTDGICTEPESRHKRKCKSKERDHGEELVGCKIKVWWPADEQFYDGVVTAFDPEGKKHKVVYTDGDEERLYLRAERWELVEDGEDSEATEDTKPDANALAKRLFHARTDSSGLANHKVCNDIGGTSAPASSICLKKRISSSSKQSRQARSKPLPDGFDSRKRKSSKVSPDEKGQKSLADVTSISAEPLSASQVVSACSETVDVGGYKVTAGNAPILRAIFAQHGDIAAKCLLKSPAMRASSLEVVCNVIKRLQTKNTASIVAELEATETEVADAEAANLDVSWLRCYLKKIREVEDVGRRLMMLKEMKTKTILVSKAARKDLEEKQAEVAAAQERLKEAERCVRALECVAEKINNDVRESEAKGSSWRNQVYQLR